MSLKPVVWLMFIMPLGLGADSLWNPDSPGWFTGRVMLQAGDVLHVTLDMETSLSLSSQKNSEKSTTLEFTGTSGDNPLGFLPVLKSGETFTGKANQTLKIKDTLAVRIKEILPGNLVLLEGGRTRNFSGGEETVTLTAVLDTRDLRGRTVSLSRLAEVKFTYILPVDASGTKLTADDLGAAGLSESRRLQLQAQYYNRFLGALFPGE